VVGVLLHERGIADPCLQGQLILLGIHGPEQSVRIAAPAVLFPVPQQLVREFAAHLGTDAVERVVMTQTYLALLEENRLTEEKDRSLVLGALFRPASDGMVKEENIPHPMLDAITQLSGKA